LLVAEDDNGSAAEFDAPIKSNIDGVFFACEELHVIHASALRSGRPGSEHVNLSGTNVVWHGSGSRSTP